MKAAMDFLQQARYDSARNVPRISTSLPQNIRQFKPFSLKSEYSHKSLNVRIICQQVTQTGSLQSLFEPVLVNIPFIQSSKSKYSKEESETSE